MNKKHQEFPAKGTPLYLMGDRKGEESGSDLPLHYRDLALPGLGIQTRKQISLQRELLEKHFEIEKHEKEILEDLEKDQFVSVDNLSEEKNIAKQAARNFMKRSSRINIRVSEADLNMVRKIAVQEGLPYQTLLASIIHKFASGRLIMVKGK